MNMQIFYRGLGIVILSCLLAIGCKEEVYVYEVNDVEISPINSTKNKPKTESQYISVLYTNLFQEAIGPNRMLEALAAIQSIGDKRIAFDILVSKYMADGRVVLPTEQEMRADPESFVRDTYRRFLIRQPTEAELQWMLNYIESRPNLTPELVYFSFATSNEHFHY